MIKCFRILLALVVCTAFLAPSAAAKLSKEAKEWMNGPVRYLMTKEEKKTFKDLATEEDIENFKTEFWSRRDPLPETPANEFKEEFWRRVEFSEKNFKSWRSDRGMIYILLGPPQQIDDNPLGADISQAGSQVWTFSYVMERRTRSDYRILFYDQDNNGNYKYYFGQDLGVAVPDDIEPCDVDFKDEHLVGLNHDGREYTPAQEAPTESAAAKQPAAGSAGGAPAMSTGTPPGAGTKASAYIERIIAGETLEGSLDVAHNVSFFKDALGNSLCVITIGVKVDAKVKEPTFVAFARLVSADDPNVYAGFESAESFPAYKGNSKIDKGYLLYQTQQSIGTGRYELYGGVHDSATGEVASFKDEVTAPDFSSGSFSLSDMVIADVLKGDPSSMDLEDKKAKPFQLGGTEIVPNIDLTYDRSQELTIFLVAYDASRDPSTDQYIFQTQYQFYRGKDGKFVRYGRPVVEETDSPGQGKFWPLQVFKAGEYKIEATVTDMISNQKATTSGTFMLAE